MTFNSNDLDEILLADDVAGALRESWGDIAHAIPELGALDMDRMHRGRAVHKDNVEHTILVTAKVPARRRVRLAALFHDVGKPPTRVVHNDGTVTFHNHESVGGRLTHKVLIRLGYEDAFAREVAGIVRLSGGTKGSEDWTESAVRRFSFEAGELLGDILDFAREDVTSRHAYKHELVQNEVATLRQRLREVREKDEASKWRPVLSGDDIMTRYGLVPGREVGQLLRVVSEAQREVESKGGIFTENEAWVLLDEKQG